MRKKLSNHKINLSELIKYRLNNENESKISKQKIIIFITINEKNITSTVLLKSKDEGNKFEGSKGELATTPFSNSDEGISGEGVLLEGVAATLLLELPLVIDLLNSRLMAVAPQWTKPPTIPATPIKPTFWIGGKAALRTVIDLLAAAARPPIAAPNPIWLPVDWRPEAIASAPSLSTLMLTVVLTVTGSIEEQWIVKYWGKKYICKNW